MTSISPIASTIMMVVMMARPGRSISVMGLCTSPSLIVARVGALEYGLLMVIPPVPTTAATIATVAGAPVFPMMMVVVIMMFVVVVVRVV